MQNNHCICIKSFFPNPRYSVCAPTLFNTMGKTDAKKCADEVLIKVGLDKDHFRTGRTKVMFGEKESGGHLRSGRNMVSI